MKKLTYLALALIAFIGTTAFTSSLIKDIDLKLNLKKGESFYMLIETAQDITQTMMGQEIKQNQTMIMGYDYDVVDVLSNGNYKIEITYKRVAFKNESDYGSTSYDSDDAESESNPAAKSFKPLLNSTYYFVCDHKGNVLEVGGLEKMIQGMVESMDFTTDEEKKAYEETLKQQYGEENMKSQLSNGMSFYPKKGVSVGDSWSKTIEMNTGMSMILTNIWTLNSINGNISNISVKSDITTNTDETTDLNGMKIKYDLKGLQTGEMEVNNATGMVNKSTLDQNIKGNMSMISEGSDDLMPTNIDVPIELNTKMTIVCTKR